MERQGMWRVGCLVDHIVQASDIYDIGWCDNETKVKALVVNMTKPRSSADEYVQ